MTNRTDTNNFYVVTPTNNNGRKAHYVELNPVSPGHFLRCECKFGENIFQDTAKRLRQEARNAGEMFTVFKGSLDTDSKFFGGKTRGFDHVVFGHQNLGKVWDTTIWKFLPEETTMPEVVRANDEQGMEYLDIAKLANYASDKLKQENRRLWDSYVSQLDASDYRTVLAFLQVILEDILEELFQKYNELVLQGKILKKEYHMQDFQVPFDQRFLERGLQAKTSGHVILELAPRWGKTCYNLHLFSDILLSKRLMVVTGYVKTVLNSYLKEYREYDFGDFHMLNCDSPDDNDLLEGLAEDRFSKDDRFVVVVPSTGRNNESFDKSCFGKRWNCVRKLMKRFCITPEETVIVNEEADYGNVTPEAERQFSKALARAFERKPLIISESGTETYKAERMECFGETICKLVVNPNDYWQIYG